MPPLKVEAHAARPARPRAGVVAAWLLAAGLGLVHDLAIWQGMGGRAGIAGPWPIARHDHPIYFHSAWVTRSFLRQSGTTAGYDPYFMAGYAKSVVFPSSSTLPEVVVALFGGRDPVRAYKLYVLISAALVPWLVIAAARAWGLRPAATAASTLLFLVYLWTDFPIQYAAFGMLPYFLGVPLGLLATGLLASYLDRGGFGRWLAAALTLSAVVLVHFTLAMVIAPAALLAYAVAWRSVRRAGPPCPASRHAGFWLLGPIVLALNAFWWWPGIPLAGTKGRSDVAFFHPEPVLGRLLKIVLAEATAESVLIGLGLIGLAVLARRLPVRAAALGGFMASGFAWGYLAGFSRAFDFLQPGRHTYAFYSGAAVAAGAALAELFRRLAARDRIAARLGVVGLALIGVRVFGPEVAGSARVLVLAPEPFLSSRPAPRLVRLVKNIKAHLQPGDRLLYEEGGVDSPDPAEFTPEPFGGGRYSGLLPYLTGVECLGGPYLKASLATNFTQFGGGELFGRAGWDRDHFVAHARLYRPAAVACWSRRARAFCRANADLVEVLDDDGAVLFGRVKGFEGDAIRGTANVEATAGRLVVRGAVADLDGRVVLRYHSVPCLRSRPPASLESVRLEGDPVPFLGLRWPPGADAVTIELDVPPPWRFGANRNPPDRGS